jgi:creatinine amidohydrolase/Fe(II)-dependent formamide hydrolase-like protein
MFFYTDTADAPWTVIKSDCKKRARINGLRYLLHAMPYANKDITPSGVVGDARAATAQKVEAVLAAAAERNADELANAKLWG